MRQALPSSVTTSRRSASGIGSAVAMVAMDASFLIGDVPFLGWSFCLSGLIARHRCIKENRLSCSPPSRFFLEFLSRYGKNCPDKDFGFLLKKVRFRHKKAPAQSEGNKGRTGRGLENIKFCPKGKKLSK
jgi:hypothetical protein